VYVAAGNTVSALGVDGGGEQWRYQHERPVVLPDCIGDDLVCIWDTTDEHFVAVSPTTGEVRWQSSVPGKPVLVEDQVFALGTELAALRPDDGDIAWTASVPGEVTDIAVTPDTVYLGGTGALSALYRVDGRERWRYEISDPDPSYWYLRPLHADADAGRVLAWDTHEFTLQSFRGDDGRERWRYEAATDEQPFPGTVTETTALVVEGDELVALSRDDGTIRWRFSAGKALDSTVQMAGGVVIVSSGRLVYGVSLRDGTLRWETSTAGEIVALEADENVTVVSRREDGGMRLSRLAGRDGSLQWVSGSKHERISTLTAGGRVYVGTVDAVRQLSTPSGLMARAERLIANEPAGLLTGGAVATGAFGVAYHYLS
jgi:outer membrane protein assembly factor BamB